MKTRFPSKGAAKQGVAGNAGGKKILSAKGVTRGGFKDGGKIEKADGGEVVKKKAGGMVGGLKAPKNLAKPDRYADGGSVYSSAKKLTKASNSQAKC